MLKSSDVTTIDKMNAGKIQMEYTLEKIKVLKEAVPGVFEVGKTNYLTEVENSSGDNKRKIISIS